MNLTPKVYQQFSDSIDIIDRYTSSELREQIHPARDKFKLKGSASGSFEGPNNELRLQLKLYRLQKFLSEHTNFEFKPVARHGERRTPEHGTRTYYMHGQSSVGQFDLRTLYWPDRRMYSLYLNYSDSMEVLSDHIEAKYGDPEKGVDLMEGDYVNEDIPYLLDNGDGFVTVAKTLSQLDMWTMRENSAT